MSRNENDRNHLQYIVLGSVNEENKKSATLKLPMLIPLVNQFYVKPSSNIFLRNGSTYSQLHIACIECECEQGSNRQFFMIEFEVTWPSMIVGHASNQAMFKSIELKAMQLFFPRNSYRRNNFLSNITDTFTINGTCLHLDNKKVTMPRQQEFTFENECVLAHYKTIKNQ